MPHNDRPRLLASGLDSLYVSYYVDTSVSCLDWDELGYQKARLSRERNGKFSETVLGGERFALRPYGRKPYTFVLSNQDYEVGLSENMQPRCHVQFLSEGLWKYGLDKMLGRIDRWISAMGFHVTSPNAVSRADWAFDYDVPAPDFLPAHFVSRAVKNANWREGQVEQSIQFGTGDTVVRVYDKVAEIAQQSGKTWFHEIWGQSEHVWRVEFQTRRERLKQAGIHTTEDMKALQNDLLRELACNHTTLRRPNADSNRSRWPLHPLWAALKADIDALPQTGLVRALDPRLPLEWRLYQLGKSLYGTLKGIAAVVALMDGETAPFPLDEFIETLPGILAPHHANDNWRHDVIQRITAHCLGQW